MKLALTDVGHAIIISHHTVHLVGIGIGESSEVLIKNHFATPTSTNKPPKSHIIHHVRIQQ
jgi:hypothetical protein